MVRCETGDSRSAGGCITVWCCRDRVRGLDWCGSVDWVCRVGWAVGDEVSLRYLGLRFDGGASHRDNLKYAQADTEMWSGWAGTRGHDAWQNTALAMPNTSWGRNMIWKRE